MLQKIVLALGLLAAPALASAHPAPFSYLDIRIGSDVIEGTLVVHIIDVAHDLDIATPERLLERSVAYGNLDRLTALINQRLSLVADGQPLTIQWGDVDPIPDRQGLQLHFRIHAARPATLGIHALMFPYDRLHQTFVNVYEDGQLVRRILLVVAYRELIDRYVAACKKAGVRLAGIDLEAFALLRALGDPLPADAPPSDAALVVVSVGHDRSTFAVSDGRVCEFTRVLDWGGSTLDVAIARELDCAPSEAEPVKRELSLAAANVPEGLTQDQADRAREAVRRQLQTFARELVSSLQFYQNQPGSLGIGEIVITGGTAHLGGVADELQRLIGVRVEVGDPLLRVKLGKKLREADEQLGSLAVAIGLGIED